MEPLHIMTPLWPAPALSNALGIAVVLKMELLQPTGSFKIRGLGCACQTAVAAGARSLVASSGGNAGLAVAWAGRRLGVPVTVVVPGSTGAPARARICAEGAALVEHGASWDDAHRYAAALAQAPATALLHPFEGEDLWAGHATLVEECAVQTERPDAIVVAVGGGGLLVGVLRGMAKVGWSGCAVIAVETRGADSFAQSLAAGRPIALAAIRSVATSLGARMPSAEAVAQAARHDVRCHVVEDDAALAAADAFQRDFGLAVDPACGAALATCAARPAVLRGAHRVLVVACGAAPSRPAHSPSSAEAPA